MNQNGTGPFHHRSLIKGITINKIKHETNQINYFSQVTSSVASYRMWLHQLGRRVKEPNIDPCFFLMSWSTHTSAAVFN